MTDLVIQLKTPLKHSNDHIRHQSDPVLDGDRLSPCWSSFFGIAKAGHDHMVEGVIRDLSTFEVNDLARTNAPSPNLIFDRAIQKAILIPTEMRLVGITHLDPSPDHTIYDLSRD